MPTVDEMLSFLAESSQDAIDTYVEQAPYPTDTEMGFRSSSTPPAGFHIRDDGVVEIYAGDARILLDPDTGSIILAGNRLICLTPGVSFTPEEDAFTVNGYPLNTDWLDPTFQALIPRGIKSLEQAYVHTTPDPTKPAVPLSTFLDTDSLFLDPTGLSSLTDRLKTILGV